MKILFISYFFEPFPGVGAKRVSYWVNNGEKHGLESTVLTATEQTEEKEHVHYVAPIKNKSPLGMFIKDPGLDWKKSLITYFENQKEFNYDFVLISGGPFMHFSVTNYLKKRFGAKVILDFRDPFSNNPSFRDNGLKKMIKSYFEKKFTKNATALIAVNKYCAELIAAPHSRIEIIDNGYDENAFSSTYDKVNNEIPIIAHAGTFIQGVRSPAVFLKVLASHFNGQVSFQQFGKDSPYFDAYRSEEFFRYEGMMPYALLVKQLEKADICLLITEGMSFESTTKVFDYIGLNKKILIITNGEPKTGNLHELTKEYPNAFWCKNSPTEIKETIDRIKNIETQPFNSHEHSRAYSLEKLIALLKSL